MRPIVASYQRFARSGLTAGFVERNYFGSSNLGPHKCIMSLDHLGYSFFFSFFKKF